MILRLHNLRNQSWWNKTRLACWLTLALGTFFSLLVLVAANNPATSTTSKSVFCLFVFPLIIVILIAMIARLQRMLDARTRHSPTISNEGPSV